MKRLLLAVVLATGMHLLLFGLDCSWFRNRVPNRPKSPILTMTLAFLEPQRPKTEPAIRKPDLKHISPVKKRKPRRVPKPEKEVRVIKPPETVKPPVQPEFSPEPEVAQIVEEPYYPTHDFSEDVIHKEVAMPVDTGVELPAVREAVPLYKINPPPKYPRIARKRGYQGTVVLEVLVDQNGKVGDLRLFKSSGYTTLDNVALASVKEWLFEPGMRGNKKVEMWVRVPIRFTLN